MQASTSTSTSFPRTKTTTITTTTSLTTEERLLSASAGAILTSLLVTPLDVVKTRLQSQPLNSSFTSSSSTPSSTSFSFSSPSSPSPSSSSLKKASFTATSTTSVLTSSSSSSLSPSSSSCSFLSHPCSWMDHTTSISHHPNVTSSPFSFTSLSPSSSYSSTLSTSVSGSGSAPCFRIKGGRTYSSGIRNCCTEVFFSNASKPCILHPPHLFKHVSIPPSSTPPFHGTVDALIKIARYEGIPTLWRGLFPTLLMSLPANVIYFMVYDKLKEFLSKTLEHSSYSFTAPLISGASARIMAATFISPIELLRTQMQGPQASKVSIVDMIHRIRWQVKMHHGLRYLFRGLGPTLWRDVPFSGLYWITYEHFKSKLHPLWPESTFSVAFLSGACSGMLAATFTAPFDVAKTRRQLSHRSIHDANVWKSLHHILKHEGIQGWFRGVVPRVMKVAPACAIMIGTYEYSKHFFAALNSSQTQSSLTYTHTN